MTPNKLAIANQLNRTIECYENALEQVKRTHATPIHVSDDHISIYKGHGGGWTAFDFPELAQLINKKVQNALRYQLRKAKKDLNEL